MKIAIQGHLTRGKEVIQILESLGGKNIKGLKGTYKTFYYIDNRNEIDDDRKSNFLPDYKLYTLEEFEKEFPFKVGDKVIHKEFNDLFEVIAFNPELTYPYKIKGVCEFNTKSYVLTKWQPKMKEERFVTLTLDKAKEWYKKGEELKEIALQAFTEEELTKVELPKTWEEFCKNYPVQKGESWLTGGDDILQCSYSQNRTHKNWIPSKKSAEAHLAMIQLEQLRDCWRHGWVPSKGDSGFGIRFDFYEGFRIVRLYSFSAFLSFPTEEMAKEFLKCFRDLIEKAGDLI